MSSETERTKKNRRGVEEFSFKEAIANRETDMRWRPHDTRLGGIVKVNKNVREKAVCGTGSQEPRELDIPLDLPRGQLL
jgi:hypothetical protein